MVNISLKIPKKLNDDLEEYMRVNGYATKTEVLRELLRAQLYKTVEGMRGVAKGNVKPSGGSHGDWRRKEWEAALKEAGGDPRKAVALLDEKEKQATSGLRL